MLVATYWHCLPLTDIEACASTPSHGPVVFHQLKEGPIPMSSRISASSFAPVSATAGDHFQTELQRDLHLAVERDDHVSAQQLLKQGADPYAGALHPKSTKMRTALEFPRRHAKLYPGTYRADET